jgi:hypothetical protein
MNIIHDTCFFGRGLIPWQASAVLFWDIPFLVTAMIDSSYLPPASEPPLERAGFRPIWLLWGCGGIALLLVLALGSCFLLAKGAMRAGQAEFEPACMRYITCLQARDADGGFALIGPEGQAKFTREQHAKLFQLVQQRLGAVKSMDVQFVQSGIDDHGRWGTIVYRTTFEKGPGTLKFVLRRSGEGYQIIGVFFDSPLFQDAINKALLAPG